MMYWKKKKKEKIKLTDLVIYEMILWAFLASSETVRIIQNRR